LALCTGGIWVLARILNESLPRYQGHSLQYWLEQANSQKTAASDHAVLVLNTIVIPRIIQTMFHDTNDSRLRLALIEQLNALPGIQIFFTVADSRRASAAQALGEIGPRAKGTIPHLIKVLKGSDQAARPAAALALGQIKSEPDTIIPLLLATLDDPQDGVPESAVEGLACFGSLSRAAVPKLLELFKVPDKDLHAAVAAALKQIAPEDAAKAEIR
jgi:HEAT repeat protein